jgi:hypothetical protein
MIVFTARIVAGLWARTNGAYHPRLSSLDSEQFPRPGHALQLVFAPVIELDSRASHQVLNCRRHEHLSGSGERRYPGSDVDRHTCHVLPGHLDLAHV